MSMSALGFQKWVTWFREAHICKCHFLWFHLNLGALLERSVTAQMLQHLPSYNILSSESGYNFRILFRHCYGPQLELALEIHFFILHLHVEINVYGSSSGVGRLRLWAKSYPLPALLSNGLLETCHTHSFPWCLWLLLWSSARGE